jgi:hypothetical protein
MLLVGATTAPYFHSPVPHQLWTPLRQKGEKNDTNCLLLGYHICYARSLMMVYFYVRMSRASLNLELLKEIYEVLTNNPEC